MYVIFLAFFIIFFLPLILRTAKTNHMSGKYKKTSNTEQEFSKTEPTKTNPEEKSNPKDDVEQEVFFKPWLVDVTPDRLRVIDFVSGNIDGRLVLHGVNPAKRLILLWKGKSNTSVRLKPAVVLNKYDEDQSVALAIDIANKVYGKKKKFQKAETVKSEVAQQIAKPGMVPAPEPVKPNSETTKPETPERPVIKGFKSKVTGILIKAGIEPHVKTVKGEAEEYKSYTATINEGGQEVSIKGNDIRRALADANATIGDTITLIHLRNEDLPGGNIRKVYSCFVVH